MASSLQLIEQRGNHLREDENQSCQERGQRPVKPRHPQGALLQPAEHLRPEVALELGLADRSARLSKQLSNSFFVLFAHGSTPRRLSFFRNRRTARKTRDLTAPTEMPRA